MFERVTFGELPMNGIGPHPAASVTGLSRIPEPKTAKPPERPNATARRRLWDLPHQHHCPVIGTCLHVDELRRLAKKAGCAPKHTLSDFEVHVSFVAAATNKNALSLAVQRLLDRRYAAMIKRFAKARTPAELEHIWDEALANGEVQGALWAVMTHPSAPAELRTLAYEDVHMLSHQIGAGLNVDLKALAETRETLQRVRKEAAAATERGLRAARERDAALAKAEELRRTLAIVEGKLVTAQVQVARLESGRELTTLRARVDAQDDEIADLRQAAREHAGVVGDLERRLDDSEQHRDAALRQLAERDASLEALERLLTAPVPEPICDGGGDCANCTREAQAPTNRIDLSGRRILCVGGRGSLNGHYRTLVERCNGELVRHDGGMEDSRTRLEALLASADAVICPLDTVSHDACLRTKRYCKQHAKPCVMMQRSGVGAFAQALSQINMSGHADAGAAAYSWLLRA